MDHYQIGPAGGNGGMPFEQYDVPADAHLSAIHVYSEWVLNALQIEYIRGNDVAGSISPVGGLGGEHHVFYLDPDEYLIGISGRAGWYIDSIRFHTNKRVSPTYGGVGGERAFSFEAKNGYEIGGFFGRSAWYIDALGVTVRPLSEVTADDKAKFIDEDAEEYQSWLELAGESEVLPASVVVRRRGLMSGEALEALEDTALAEAIAGMSTVAEEGTVDAAVYSQVIEDEGSGGPVAIVLAVASEMGTVESVGDDPQEVAVMVTDSIETDEEMALLEEEAVENAIDLLLEEMEEEADEVEVTIYSGISQDEADNQLYGAVVAIATRLPAESPQTGAAPAENKSKKYQQPGKDLQLIEGIGPKIAELLMANGIHDLADLADTPVEQIREMLLAAGRRFRLADPGSWPEQARLGASGLWDALSDLQARLKGGR